MGQSLRWLRSAPRPVWCIVALEVVKSGLFRDPTVQNVDLAVDGRQIAEALMILLTAGAVLLEAGALRRAAGALPVFTRLALGLYALCIAASVPVSLNPPLTVLRGVEVFDYLSAALLWGAVLRRQPGEARYADRVRAVAKGLCVLYIALTALAALVHFGAVDLAEALKSNAASVPCALLLVLSVEAHGLRPDRGTAVALLGLVLFQSLASVLAGLTGVAWLGLEGVVLGRYRLAQPARLVLLGASLSVAAALYPVALTAVESVGELMGRDTRSVTNLTGRAELWGNLVHQIGADPAKFALGLGFGVGERVYVQNFSETYKRDLAAIGIVDVALHRHSHNTILAAIINIGFVGAVATLLFYLGGLLAPPAADQGDARALFVCFLALCVNGVSTNLFASSDLLTVVVMLLVATPRGPAFAAARWPAMALAARSSARSVPVSRVSTRGEV